jgi:predicted phage baseplate assembly protein
MPLPAPNLDDRRFQDLVDEARRRVQRHCPQWTDHNVSDPGITLIETFADMVDQLLYRLNRVPELHYLRFLDLIGVRPFPPTAARCDVTFWLSAARDTAVIVPAGNQVASERSEVEDPVVFTVEQELPIVPCSLTHLATAGPSETPTERTDELLAGKELPCFGTPPQPGDTLLFGLSNAVPSCAVLLRIDCQAPVGHGVDPRNPPWVWQAWDGSGWAPCTVDRDTTGGFNKPGDVVLHVPPAHTASVLARQRAGWLRCRLVKPEPGQPFYREPPMVRAVTASTIGGTTAAVHADVVRDEIAGISEGVHGQVFPLARRPIVAGGAGNSPTAGGAGNSPTAGGAGNSPTAGTGPMLVEVAGTDGWQEWQEVGSFAQSGPDDRHVLLDRVAGEIHFGPAVRQPDGTLRQHGAAPAKGATIRVPVYTAGGGARGNVARGVLRVHRDPVPFVSEVVNRHAAAGGVDGESVRDAATRGPLLLRTRDRAVTAEDYEHLAREAAPEVARVRCVPADGSQDAVRVLIVPAVSTTADLGFAELDPNPALIEKIAKYLDTRRCIGARVSVEPPFYQGVTVVAQLRAHARTAPEALRTRATDALYGYLNPVSGGPDGRGWPFGRPLQSGEIFAVLQQVPGVEMVDEVLLFAANPATGERGNQVQRINLGTNALVFSFGHQVRVNRS